MLQFLSPLDLTMKVQEAYDLRYCRITEISFIFRVKKQNVLLYFMGMFLYLGNKNIVLLTIQH